MMNMKKTALASAISLVLASGSVWAITSTKDVAVIVDKTEVRAGEIVNVAIMGLDSQNGKIDPFGEQDGSVLIATVKSKLGKVILGSATPGEEVQEQVTPSVYTPFTVLGDVPIENELNVKYIELLQGIGRVHIEYPANAQYQGKDGNLISDEITVLLQQRFSSGTSTTGSGGRNVEFSDIAGIGVIPDTDCPPDIRGGRSACPYKVDPIKIKIKPPSTDPGKLDIVAFVPATPVAPGNPVSDCMDKGIIPATIDKYGKADCYTDKEPNGIIDNEDGIQGVMTAGTRGGTIVVKAENSSINGFVRVKLREVGDMMAMEGPDPQKGDQANQRRLMQDYLPLDADGNPKPQVYTYTGRMIQGIAKIELDSSVTEAGDYYVEAEFKVEENDPKDEDKDGYAYPSIDMVYRDTLKVMPTGVPKSIRLTSVKERMIADPNRYDGGKPGTPLMAELLDEFGNPTPSDLRDATGNPGTMGDIVLTVRDTAGIANNALVPPDKGVMQLVVKSGMDEADPMPGSDDWLGNVAGEIVKPTGTMSLTATATGLDGAALSSNAVSVKVLSNTLIADPIFDKPPRAGEDFDAFRVTTSDLGTASFGQDPYKNRVVVQNVSTQEKSTVRRNDQTQKIETRFNHATILGSDPAIDDDHHELYKWFLVSDEAGQYAQVLYEAPWGIGTNAGVSVELANAHSMSLTKKNEEGMIETTAYPPKLVGDKNILVIPEFGFKMEDCFGNPVTGRDARDKVGTLVATSPNAAIAYQVPGNTSFAVPSQDNFLTPPSLKRSNVTFTYETKGSKRFNGSDRIEVRFTKPGLVAGPCRSVDKPSDSGTDPFVIVTEVGQEDKQKKLAAYLEGEVKLDKDGKPMADSAPVLMQIPVNSAIPLTVESLIEDGKDKDDNVLWRLFSDHQNVRVKMTIDTGANETSWLPDIREIQWKDGEIIGETPVSHGSILDFTRTITGSMGRKTFVVYGGPVPRKPFEVKFTTLMFPTESDCKAVGGVFAEGVCDKEISTSRKIEVTETVANACAANNLDACTTEAACVGIGGEFTEGVCTLGCSADNLPACDTQAACEAIGGNFKDDVCSIANKTECEGSGGIYANNECFPVDEKGDKVDNMEPPAASTMDGGQYGDNPLENAAFSGGTLVTSGENSGKFGKEVTVKLSDKVNVSGVIKVEKRDEGKKVDIVVAAFHVSPIYVYEPPFDKTNGGVWYMMTSCESQDLINIPTCPSFGWKIQTWKHDEHGNPVFSLLQPLLIDVELPMATSAQAAAYHTVNMYKGNFVYTTPTEPLLIYFGYVVKEGDEKGKVVYNAEPLKVTIE